MLGFLEYCGQRDPEDPEIAAEYILSYTRGRFAGSLCADTEGTDEKPTHEEE